MSRRAFRAAAFLLFGFVPLVAVIFAFNANSLPPALMAHFDDRGNPVAWISKIRFFELYLACTVTIGVAGLASAFLTPKGWLPDVVSWVGLVGLFTAAALMLCSERLVLRQVPSRFGHDPVVDSLFLTGMAMFVAWGLFRWTQR